MRLLSPSPRVHFQPMVQILNKLNGDDFNVGRDPASFYLAP